MSQNQDHEASPLVAGSHEVLVDETSSKPRWRRPVLRIAGAAAILGAPIALSVHPEMRLHERARGLAQWAEPLSGFLPLLAIIVGLLAWNISRRSLHQRRRADERAEWWRRVQAGVDLVTAEKTTFRASGFSLLSALIDEPQVPVHDLVLLRQIMRDLRTDVGSGSPGEGAQSQARWPRRALSGLRRIGSSSKLQAGGRAS